VSFIEGPARDQASLLPRRVDDYVEADPVACSKSLIDEGYGERARQSDPEHDRQASDQIFKVTRWPTSFLRAMIRERTAWADKDFTCTGLKKPARAKCARPRASLRSVL
jgi:hypothetical protein